jgi:hypothetical protein
MILLIFFVLYAAFAIWAFTDAQKETLPIPVSNGTEDDTIPEVEYLKAYKLIYHLEDQAVNNPEE